MITVLEIDLETYDATEEEVIGKILQLFEDEKWILVHPLSIRNGDKKYYSQTCNSKCKCKKNDRENK